MKPNNECDSMDLCSCFCYQSLLSKPSNEKPVELTLHVIQFRSLVGIQARH